MVESERKEYQQKAACRLKGTFVDNKQGLGRKATGCRQ